MPQAEPLPQRPGKARRFVSPKPQRAKGAPPAVVHYPVSDGKPMSESDLHADVSHDLRAVLKVRHIDRPDAYVGGNCFMYPEEGKPKVFVSPDLFVAYGVPEGPPRDVWQVWVEGKVPDFILEVTSRSTRKEDERRKKDFYEGYGVPEYWQFDPTGDYLDPILKGRALDADGRYRELELEDRDGGLCGFSEVLGLDLRLEEGRLRFFDPKRGEYLLTPVEQHEALEERDRALEAAEARVRELERQRRPKG